MAYHGGVLRGSGYLCVAAIVLLVGADRVRAKGGKPSIPWEIPAEGACTSVGLLRPTETTDAAPPQPGAVVTIEGLPELRPYLPPEVWALRDRFFYEGMKLEVGPCFRDYGPPEFFREATERFRGQAELSDKGVLENYTAGLPFPPDAIDPANSRAGLEWAWNAAAAYAAGGQFNVLRTTTIRRELISSYEGEAFLVPLIGRSERPDEEFRLSTKLSASWVTGGHTDNPRVGSECAWRQYGFMDRRPELAVYDPSLRRVRRLSPQSHEGAIAMCTSEQASFSVRGAMPQLYSWTIVGLHDVLAPINVARPVYPEDEDRYFGPFGASLANDRWELRRVIVLEGTVREREVEDHVRRFVWYFDQQTLFPLYYAAYREDGSPAGAGYIAGRWSEDRSDYPRWPDDPDRPVRKVDRVAIVMIDWNERAMIRLEAWNTVSTPPADKQVGRMISQSSLRGR